MGTPTAWNTFRTFIWLHKPSAEPYKISSKETSFNEIMQSLEEKGSTFVRQPSFPVPGTSDFLTFEELRRQQVGEVGVVAVPEDPEFLRRVLE